MANVAGIMWIFAGILSYIPFWCNLSLKAHNTFVSRGAESSTVSMTNSIMIGVASLMLFEAALDRISFDIMLKGASLFRLLMILGILSSSIIFGVMDNLPPDRKLVLLVNSFYARNSFIGAPLAYQVLENFKMKNLLMKSALFSVSLICIGTLYLYSWAPFFSSGNSLASLSFATIIVAFLIIVCILIYGLFTYVKNGRVVYQSGMQKYSVFHYVFLFIYYFGGFLISVGFGSKPWEETTPNELASYFILDLFVSSVIFTLPSRMAQYDSIIAQVIR